MLRCFVLSLMVMLGAVSAYALEPDELALIVNKRVPAGRTLAEYYAQVRHIPADRFIELNLPAGDDISFDDYERNVVPPVQEFLRAHNLEKKVTCLVTFYGIPLRIFGHSLTAAEKEELAKRQEELQETLGKIEADLKTVESLVSQLDESFHPSPKKELEDFVKRADDVNRRLLELGLRAPDAQSRERLKTQVVNQLQIMGGRVALYASIFPSVSKHGNIPPAQQEFWTNLGEQVKQAQQSLDALSQRRFDPVAREDLLTTTKENFGLINYARQLRGTIEYLKPEETGAALDSELSLLWWTFYPRSRWVENPLSYRSTLKNLPRTMMVSRLDGPQSGTARDIIAASVQVEERGLRGKIVCDSRGMKFHPEKPDAYAGYDETIHNLAELVRTKTALPLAVDDSPEVLPANSAKDVALYVGWYKLRNYVPACQFNPGAVGFHIASLELVSLKSPDEHGWCRGMLNDGIAATMGAVAEPYLMSFPRADDFFPLLMTGKLTLAEVYWRTISLASWQLSLIGDPLYRPFKNNPALKVEDLPERLRSALQATTAPTTRGAN